MQSRCRPTSTRSDGAPSRTLHVLERDHAAAQPQQDLEVTCAFLSEMTLPPNLTEIGHSALSGCTSLSEITLSPNLTEIGQHAFSECMSLSAITLPPNLTGTGESALSGCTFLSEMTLPPKLTKIWR